MNNLLIKSKFLELCRYEEFRSFVRLHLDVPEDINLDWHWDRQRKKTETPVIPIKQQRFDIIKFAVDNENVLPILVDQFVFEKPFFTGVLRAVENVAAEVAQQYHNRPEATARKAAKYADDVLKVLFPAIVYIKLDISDLSGFRHYFDNILIPRARSEAGRKINIWLKIDPDKALDAEYMLRFMYEYTKSFIDSSMLYTSTETKQAYQNALNHIMTDTDFLYNFFDRVVVINLDRRTDRWEGIQKKLSEIKWPFKTPERFSAYDGKVLPPPLGWKDGAGTWGCLLSHREVLAQALKDGKKDILVLEDDIFFVDDFEKKVLAFIREVPPDWDQIMLGGQYFETSKVYDISPHVKQVSICHRAHAYAVRGRFMQYMYSKLNSTYGHVDHIMNTFQERYKVYVPSEFLIGQDGSASDISGARGQPNMIRNAPKEGTPIFVIKPDKDLYEAVWNSNLPLHFGKLDNGQDVELTKIIKFFDERDYRNNPKTYQSFVAAIHKWLVSGTWYARSMYPSKFFTILHPFNTHFKVIKDAADYSINLVFINSLDELKAHLAKYENTEETLPTQFDEKNKIKRDHEPNPNSHDSRKEDTIIQASASSDASMSALQMHDKS